MEDSRQFSEELKKNAELVHWICSVPVGITICILGLLGNSVSVLVWTRIRRRMRETNSTIKYFISMGLIDSGLLIFFILHDSIPAANPGFVHTYWFSALYSFFFFPFFFFFLLSSIWIVAAVTMDRYLLIVLQIKVSKTLNSLVLFSLFFTGFTVNLPHFFFFKPVPAGDQWTWAKTEYAETDAAFRYEFWMHCIFIILIPWTFIAVLNLLIVLFILKTSNNIKYLMSSDYTGTTGLSVSKASHEKRNMKVEKGLESPISNSEKAFNRRQDQNRKTTSTLLTVTFTFLILLLWQCIAQCFWMQEWHKNDLENPKIWFTVDISFGIAKLGIVFYSSINCILYFLSGSLFRKELRKLFRLSIQI